MIHIESDWSRLEKELDRLDRMPDAETVARLNRVLDLGFSEVQASTHVETGSLKASGKKKSKVNRTKKQWAGELSMGGASTGVHPEVDYAIYEKERGGIHDFYGTLPLLHPFFVRAIKGGLTSG